MNRTRHYFFSLVIFLLIISPASGQSKFTVNGYVKDSTNGESVISATIAINGKSITSNSYGFYSVTLDEGEYDVLVSHVAYLSQSFHLSLHQNIVYNIYLIARSAAMNEVIVYSKRRD